MNLLGKLLQKLFSPPVVCQKCGRPLTNAASIERGMGACCAKKKVRDDKTIDMFAEPVA